MDDLERYLDRVCRGLGGAASLRRHLREELREHIREAAERYKATGLAPDEALQKAISDFGEPGSVHEGLEDVYGRDVMGILIEKAMQWKEKTMKAKWLWSGTASLLLLVAICAQGFFSFCAVWLILPKLKEIFKDVGQELPRYAIRFLQLADFLIFGYGWLWVCVPLLLAWAVFEWRYRGEHKSLIRLSALTLVSLTTTALMWWAGIVATIPMFDAYGALLKQRPEQVMLEGMRMADEAMARLEAAAKGVDRDEILHAMRAFAGALDEHEYRGSAAAGLATMMHPQLLEQIRSQQRELMDLCVKIHKDTHDILEGRHPRLREHVQQLKEEYARLKVLVGEWPGGPASQPATGPSAGSVREESAHP
jgi:hypothetical protein